MRELTDCEIHTFDPTLNPSRPGADPGRSYDASANRGYTTFHDMGLAGVEDAKSGLLPLSDIMAVLGHTGRRIDVLKVDCGA